MSQLEFFLVDVFAQGKYSGNQLAVFKGAENLAEPEMQRIAREINFSESAFVLSPLNSAQEYDVRIFTPAHQVPFAGHPVLGTAHVLRSLSTGAAQSITLNLPAGRFPITTSPDNNGNPIYWMIQNKPVFGRQLNADQLAPVLGVTVSDIDTRFPIEEVSTGLPHIIIPLVSLNALRGISVNLDEYYRLIGNCTAKNLLVFSPETYECHNHISTRMFADYLGIPEDPATGSGNGCLAGYLVKHRYFGSSEISLRSEQGYEMGRPSLLHLRAHGHEGNLEIRVGGAAEIVAEGRWRA